MKILFKLYATKSDIRELMGGSEWGAVTKVFKACKALEEDPLNIRPTKVPSQLVFKVLGINYNFALKQYKESKGEGVESWTPVS
ncbi:MAG: hypothetical protein AB9921_00080 [Erysipelotrichaceae bacterium]